MLGPGTALLSTAQPRSRRQERLALKRFIDTGFRARVRTGADDGKLQVLEDLVDALNRRLVSAETGAP